MGCSLGVSLSLSADNAEGAWIGVNRQGRKGVEVFDIHTYIHNHDLVPTGFLSTNFKSTPDADNRQDQSRRTPANSTQ